MEKLQIIGNLTKDPELRTTQTGISVCSFTVAVNQRPSKAQREANQQPPAKFFRVTAWRELGENCAKYLLKGRKVYCEGTVSTSAYISDKDGKPYAGLEMTADNVEFLSSRGDAGDGSPSAGNAAQTPAADPAQSAPAAPPEGFTPVEEDNLPF
jgi:single-strand DNA-binding protein